jgi:triacylglycerol lipase
LSLVAWHCPIVRGSAEEKDRMAKKRVKRAASGVPSGFDKQFALNTTLPLAEAAYDVAGGKPPLLPSGYTLIGPIQIDTNKSKLLMKRAALPQQRMMRAFLDEGHIGGLVARNDQSKTLAISFRGTRTPEEWLKDLDFVLAPYAPVKNWGPVHQGFQLVYLAMQASLEGLVSSAIGTCTDIWITGHSLGGAVSVLCAPDVAINMTKIVPRLHTYAGPRSGQASFDDKFDKLVKTCFRVVNRWDIVPQLPPVVALYRHVGVEVQVDGGFTLDLKKAHSLELSYRPGLERLSARKLLMGMAA